MDNQEVTPVKGQFPSGVSGNKMGRPKGSKNKITLMKLMAEEAVREQNSTRMLEVCAMIVDQALEGDKPSQKLIWQSVVSNGVSEEKGAAEKVKIEISGMEQPKAVTVIENPPQEEV